MTPNDCVEQPETSKRSAAGGRSAPTHGWASEPKTHVASMEGRLKTDLPARRVAPPPQQVGQCLAGRLCLVATAQKIDPVGRRLVQRIEP